MPAKTAASTALIYLYSAHDQTALFAGKPAPTEEKLIALTRLKNAPPGRARRLPWLWLWLWLWLLILTFKPLPSRPNAGVA
ncbi:hypothetical protein Q7L38_02695 [Pseudomonas protegens]|uniref:hypothetical protein n=1 Tax=Pseudomonas protegens TaxID=380021 RepID=UPI0027771E34|nr:hypothetical protein [Pseudomonas protegens]MDP9531464.1 hypothetical protein [Pseudomonas protegens]